MLLYRVKYIIDLFPHIIISYVWLSIVFFRWHWCFQTLLLTEVKGWSKSLNLSNHPDLPCHLLMISIRNPEENWEIKFDKSLPTFTEVKLLFCFVSEITWLVVDSFVIWHLFIYTCLLIIRLRIWLSPEISGIVDKIFCDGPKHVPNAGKGLLFISVLMLPKHARNLG